MTTTAPSKASPSKRSGGSIALLTVGWILAGLGLLWIVIFYVSQSQFPVPALGSWNIPGGLVWIVIGTVLAFVSSKLKPAPLSAGAVQSEQLNGVALAAIIVVWFVSIVGLVLGHIALSQTARTGERGHGLALTAVIVGWISVGLYVIGFIVIFNSY